MTEHGITVRAMWDPEARVFVATSDDVPGLVAEAADMGARHEKLAVLIPELLELNRDGAASADASELHEVPLVVELRQHSTIRVPA
jgi:hypothetical protein